MEQEKKDILQNELAHWKRVVKELEQNVDELRQNEIHLIAIADNWQEIAKRYKKNAEVWEHAVVRKERRIAELLMEIEELRLRGNKIDK